MPQLTDRAVKQAKTEDAPYKLFDERGLFALIHPNGSKYWRLRFRFAGKERLLALGVYPEVTLAEARELRDEARKQVKVGTDPVLVRKERKRDDRLRAANSFEVVAREWLAQLRTRWSDDHVDRVYRSLKADVFPWLGTRAIADITADEVIDVLKRVEGRDALEVLMRVRQRCSKVFRYAIATKRLKTNPVADVDTDAFRSRKVTHRASITRDDLPEYMKRLAAYDGHPTTKLGLKLVLLTFVRSSELRSARWSQFDLDREEWRIPAEIMKMDRPHIVPLATQALAVLEEIRKHSWHDDLLFPSQNGGGKIMSENTLLYALYRMGYHSRATVHGFRSTASTILNETLEFDPDVIERQLAHVEDNKVRKAYNHAQYLPERRRMMQAWADFLDTISSKVAATDSAIGKRSSNPTRRGAV